MEQMLILLSTLTLILTATISTADNTGATEGSNAQAISSNSGSSSGSIGGSDKLLLVRRYVPRFVGKRDPEDAEIDNVSVLSSDKSDDNKINYIDDYVENLLEYYDDLNLNEFDKENEKEDSISESDIESFVSESEYENEKDEKDDILMDSQGEKRYVPSFVGKRYNVLDDNEDELIDESKRYRPMFVGKRYRPMFVGKRFQPRFIGKRYTPRFIGKRYTPRFIGKRYTPRFIGKRYTPRFIGKRYTPRFIGKRYTPRFIGKRYAPRFIGKRLQPFFVGKKSSLDESVQEKRYKPFFVGKRNQDEILNENSHIEKRSLSDTTDKVETTQANAERSKRSKRSLGNANDESMKRAWGRYIPLKSSLTPAYRLPAAQPSYMEKRFVAPEFIGRRDSLSTILSALDALQFARPEPRTTSKRFEAPLFIGKRAPTRPRFIGKRDQAYNSEMNVPSGYSYMPGITEFNTDAFESIPDEFSPFRDIYPYSKGLQGSNDEFKVPSYLTSAMRFSVSGIAREPTEEEILDDVEKLGFDTFDNHDADIDLLSESMEPIYVDDLPGELHFPQEQKRYEEFLGKRQSETRHLPHRIKAKSAIKRWAEFVGKRSAINRIYNPIREYSKRYMEFLGKRSSLKGDGFEQKRYAEFLG